jgi:nicotinate-nucleotide pyrophosphorylase
MHTLEEKLLQLALQEDLGSPAQDVTTQLLFTDNTTTAQAKIRSKHAEPITLCGIPYVHQLFALLADSYAIHTTYQDGDRIFPGETLLTIDASAPTLLRAERTLLNVLRHLSAIATLTRKYVDRVQPTALKILDTRKTTPGLRSMEKYAVHCGGGVNHRFGLYDAILVKDTHVDMLGGMQKTLEILLHVDTKNISISPEDAVFASRSEITKPGDFLRGKDFISPLNSTGYTARPPNTSRDFLRDNASTKTQILKDERYLPVIIEVRSPEELEVVLQMAAHIVTRVLLDNMSLEVMAHCVARCQGLVETEASGNIRLETILGIAQTGVQYASVGELTYNAGHVDLSMYTSA